MKHPALRRDDVLIVSIEELEFEIVEFMPALREEGFSEKFFIEIGVLARNKVEDGGLQAIGLQYSPQDAIRELIEESFIGDRLTCHLGPQEAVALVNAAYLTSFRAYIHIDTLLTRMGFATVAIEEFDVYVDDWISDTDFLLCINYR
jgi:hypothetical protein